MSEKARKIIVFAVFILSLIWGYVNFFGGENKKKASFDDQFVTESLANNGGEASMTMPGPADQVSQAPIVTAAIPENILEAYKSRSWGKNPFYHTFSPGPARTAKNPVALHLLGILYREINAQALINGTVVKIGDEIQGYRIMDITKEYVVLKKDDKTFELRVTKESA